MTASTESGTPPENPIGVPYAPVSESFYAKLTTPGQMVTIAAPTGFGKSLLAGNCAAYVIHHRGQVVWVNFEMKSTDVNLWLACMLSNTSTETAQRALRSIREMMASLMSENFWYVEDRRGIPWCRQPLDLLLQRCVRPVTLLVLDGFDCACSMGTPAEFSERCALIAAWASTQDVCVIATSQMKVAAVGSEINDIDQLAFSAIKAQTSDTVATIGRTPYDELRTVSIVKDQNRSFTARTVFHLNQLPSLRLDVMAVADGLSGGSQPIPSAVYVNCTQQEMETLVPPADDAGSEDDGADQNSGSCMAPYHSLKGFVAIGRAVFASPAYQNRDWKALGWLLSLYEMATFKQMTRYAPGTKIPVTFERGQIMTSSQTLATRWGMKKKQVQRFLDRAQAQGLIKTTHFSADGGGGSTPVPTGGTRRKVIATVITLCHYDSNDGANKALAE